MNRFYLLFLLILQFCLACAQSETNNLKSFQITQNFEESDLNGFLTIYSTEDSTITLQDVLTKPSDFKLISKRIPDLGIDNRFHWIRFTITNTTSVPQDLVSYLHSNELNDVCFYAINKQNDIVTNQMHFSDQTLINQKPLPSLFFAFPISIKPNQQLTIYWRILRNQGNVVIPLRLYTREEFFFFSAKYIFFAYLNYGILAFTFLLSTILYFVTRYKLLYYYGGYCLFYLLLCLSNEGILKQYMNLNAPFSSDDARILFSGILLFFILKFSLSFLQIDKRKQKKIYQTGNVLSYFAFFLSLITLLTPLSPTATVVFGVIIVIDLAFVFFLIIYSMTKGKRKAYVYFVAISPFFFNCIWFALVILLNLSITWFYFESILFITLFEFVILGLELGYQLVNDRNNYLQSLNQLQWKFTTSILNAQDSERERIASDLHDDLGGTIATIRRRVSDIKMRFANKDLIKELDELEPMIKKSGDDLRRISHNLMPPEFARIGLLNSLAQLVQSLPKLPTRFEFLTAGTEKKLPVDIELNIYRIVTELIQNILKHAQAKHATVQMLFFHDELRILVEDNGVGNLSSKSGDASAGLGVKNCNLRANYIGAKLSREVSSAGTFVVLDIPYTSTSYEPPTPYQDTLS